MDDDQSDENTTLFDTSNSIDVFHDGYDMSGVALYEMETVSRFDNDAYACDIDTRNTMTDFGRRSLFAWPGDPGFDSISRTPTIFVKTFFIEVPVGAYLDLVAKAGTGFSFIPGYSDNMVTANNFS